jgi:hypothetical protein
MFEDIQPHRLEERETTAVVNSQSPATVVTGESSTTNDEYQPRARQSAVGHSATKVNRAIVPPIYKDRQNSRTAGSSRRTKPLPHNPPADEIERACGPTTDLLRRGAERHRRSAAEKEASKKRQTFAVAGRGAHDNAKAHSRASKRGRSALDDGREDGEDTAAPPNKRRRSNHDDNPEEGEEIVSSTPKRRLLVPSTRSS